MFSMIWEFVITWLPLLFLGSLLGLGGCTTSLRGEGSVEIGFENRNVIVIRHRVAEGNDADSEATLTFDEQLGVPIGPE